MSYRNRRRFDETKIEQVAPLSSTTKISTTTPQPTTTNSQIPKIIKRLERNSFTIGSGNSRKMLLNNHNNLKNASPIPSTSLTTQQAKELIQAQHKTAAIERSQSQVTQRSRRLYDTSSRSPRLSCDVLLRTNNNSTDVDNTLAQFTLILMGAPMVGKSTLVNQFLWEIFIRDYRPTVEEFNWIEYDTKSQKKSHNNSSTNNNNLTNGIRRPSSVINNNTNQVPENLLLQIIDSAGSRDFLAMRYLYYKIGEAFMVIYALNDPLSYAEALQMIREIQQRNTKNAPILLVANKSDTIGNSQINEIELKPTCEQLLSLGSTNRVEWICISAKNLEQVKNTFWHLIEELANRRQIGNSLAGGIQLHKRRQSMPSRRTANELGFDEETLEQLVRKHESHTRANCTIS